MKNILILISISIIFCQEAVSFSGESTTFELDGVSPNIEWLSPQNGEYFERGETITVSWTATDDSFDTMPISISLTTTAGELISEWNGLANTGNTNLTLPEVNFTNANFSISATDNYGNNSIDNADGDIHIGFVQPISFNGESNTFVLDGVPPIAEVVSPNGGENYIMGENIPVSWSAEDDSPNGTAALYFSTNSGTNFELVDSGLSFSGNTNSTLPQILTDNALFQIQISDYYGNTTMDVSDNPFSIGPIPDILFSALSNNFILDSIDPIINWLSPNGGEVLASNSLSPVTWSALDDSFGDSPITISYSSDDVQISNDLLAEDVANMASLNVLMPNISSDAVTFHIATVDNFGNSSNDDSDDSIAIHHFGCTDSEADNFDEIAEIDDGICVFTYSRQLHEGANLVSFPILPADGEISLVMGNLGANLGGIIGEGTAASQLSPNVWVGSLESINRTSGYWLKMNIEDELIFSGTRTSAETVYSLHSGANLISWPFTSSSDISSALPNDIESAVGGIIGEGTAATQIAPGAWVGSLTNFNGGEGYWFKTIMDLEFSFNSPTLLNKVASINSLNDVPHELQFEQSMNQAFYFVESIEDAEIGDWIIAMNNDVIIGAREWKGEFTDIPVMGYDGAENTAGYIEKGVYPSFYILKDGSMIELMGEIPTWQNNEIYILSTLSRKKEFPDNFQLSSVYPNPFNPSTTIEYSLKSDSDIIISIYDISGREVMRLVNSQIVAGYHSVNWDASYFASGVYFVKMHARPLGGEVATDFTQTQKLMLVK